MKKQLEELVLCQCENMEHQMMFRTVTEDGGVFVTFHLCRLPFWKRLIHGIKYIFGYTSRYGDFDEMILRPSDVDKLRKVVEHMDEVEKNFKDGQDKV